MSPTVTSPSLRDGIVFEASTVRCSAGPRMSRTKRGNEQLIERCRHAPQGA